MAKRSVVVKAKAKSAKPKAKPKVKKPVKNDQVAHAYMLQVNMEPETKQYVASFLEMPKLSKAPALAKPAMIDLFTEAEGVLNKKSSNDL